MSREISTLGAIAQNTKYSEQLRIEAVKSLASYLSNPRAVSILSSIALGEKVSDKLKLAAISSLGKSE